MARCCIHEKTVFANDGECPRCKNCKHSEVYRMGDETLWRCFGCYRILKEAPKGAKTWKMTEIWEEL